MLWHGLVTAVQLCTKVTLLQDCNLYYLFLYIRFKIYFTSTNGKTLVAVVLQGWPL